jgi:nascent polypeptide-associated complex subunit alpha
MSTLVKQLHAQLTTAQAKNESLQEKLEKKKKQLRNNRWKRKNLEADLEDAQASVEHYKSVATLHQYMATENKRHLDRILSLHDRIVYEKKEFEERTKSSKYLVFDEDSDSDSESESEESVSEEDEGVDDKDVTMVMQQAGVTHEEAAAALRKEKGDIVNAIMNLSGIDKREDISKIRAETASGSSIPELSAILSKKSITIPKYQRDYIWNMYQNPPI